MKYLLVDESPQVLRHLLQFRDAKERKRVDIILDNSGLELFSDLCFAHALTELLGAEVHLHTKVGASRRKPPFYAGAALCSHCVVMPAAQRDPMFVSDAMPKDIYQLIDALEEAAKVCRITSLVHVDGACT
jgi:hypothetical protein